MDKVRANSTCVSVCVCVWMMVLRVQVSVDDQWQFLDVFKQEVSSEAVKTACSVDLK